MLRANPQNAAITGDRFEYAGRVFEPGNLPAAGAKLHLAYAGYNGQAPPAIRATSDSEGRFRMQVRKEDFVDIADETPWNTTQVVATASGFGLGWTTTSDANTRPSRMHTVAFGSTP